MSTAGVVSAAGVAAYILFLARPTTEAWYPWHPALMAAGTLFLMTLAIHIMRRGNPAPYRQKVRASGKEREGEEWTNRGREKKRRRERENRKRTGKGSGAVWASRRCG